jgi:DNA polymerase-3 subunit delta
MVFGQTAKDDKSVAVNIGVNPFFVKDYMATAKNYGYEGVEAACCYCMNITFAV